MSILLATISTLLRHLSRTAISSERPLMAIRIAASMAVPLSIIFPVMTSAVSEPPATIAPVVAAPRLHAPQDTVKSKGMQMAAEIPTPV